MKRTVKLKGGPLDGREVEVTEIEEELIYHGHAHSSKVDPADFKACLYRKAARRGIYQFVRITKEGMEAFKLSAIYGRSMSWKR